MDAAEECLKKQLERDRSHDPVYRAYMTIDDYKSENAELRKQLEIANKIAADNPGLFIENCNLKAEIAELKAHCKAVDEVNAKMKCCGNCKHSDTDSDYCIFCTIKQFYFCAEKNYEYWELAE